MLAPLAAILLTQVSVFETAAPIPIADGYRFTEGPTWVASAKHFVFCDMRGNAVYQWSGKPDEKPTPFLSESGAAVGATFGSGRLFLVATASRSIVSVDSKGKDLKTVAERLDGKRLGGMNDLAMHKNGSLYVTHGEWFLRPGDKEFDFSGVLRIAKDGTLSRAAEGIPSPNGICFSPDGKTAYVTEYGPARILKFTVAADGTFKDQALFVDLKALAAEHKIQGGGGADGLRCDAKGRIFATGPGGVYALDTTGKLLGHLPTRCTNLALGGPDGKTMLITTGGGVAMARIK